MEEVSGAIVRDLGPPAVAGARLKQNIGAADVTMYNGVRLHQVKVVECSGHIQADGGDLSMVEWYTL